ncbi:MAG: uroporphyrinogen decarboxylase family protein [Bacillota bacterium]
MGLDKATAEIQDQITRRAEVEESVKQKLQIDVDGIYPGAPGNWEFTPVRQGNYLIFEDEFGITWRMPVEDGLYYDMYHHPLQNIESDEDINNYIFHKADDPARFVDFPGKIRLSRDKHRPYILNAQAGLFELALWIRGFSKFYMDLAIDPSRAERLLDKLLDFKKKYWQTALAYTEDELIIVAEADDLAGEENSLISPDMYRKYIKPRHKKLFDFIKQEAEGETYIFYHSCGAIRKLIPDLIEEGVDILNPVQISARDMDPGELKQEFGDKITFWGGGIDTRETLPHGSPEEVREETKRNIEALAPDGGFVFATVHNVQADVPVENFMAMWETLKEYGR